VLYKLNQQNSKSQPSAPKKYRHIVCWLLSAHKLSVSGIYLVMPPVQPNIRIEMPTQTTPPTFKKQAGKRAHTAQQIHAKQKNQNR
jgi:hypothetical protein